MKRTLRKLNEPLRCTVFIVAVLSGCLSCFGQLTVFEFDSSIESFVGQGESHTATPESGFTFAAGRNFDNGVSLRIRQGGGLDWSLDLAAPFDQTLVPGRYDDAARFPFQQADQPGLAMSGNGRGNSRIGGFFEVLEADYAPNGDVVRFAVDFTQLGEEKPEWWIDGVFRFNSTVSIARERRRDLTGNGTVDFQDLTILLANWNLGATPSRGNLIDPENTPVNFADLTALLSDWGPAAGGSPEAALGEAVPEPSALILAVTSLLGLCLIRRRRI